jgi:hypothetical protein
MNITDLNREIELTLENTYDLYQLILAVTDYNIDNNQISNLTAQTLRKIRETSSVDPYDVITSMPDTKELVLSIVKQLQEEAKA